MGWTIRRFQACPSLFRPPCPISRRRRRLCPFARDERARGDDLAGRAADHAFCLGSDRHDGACLLVNRDDRGLVDHDAPAPHIDERVVRAKINAYVLGKMCERIGKFHEILLNTSAADTILDLASPRLLISTPFFSIVFSLATTRHGRPMRSASANRSPAVLSARSSYSTAMPFFSICAYIFSASLRARESSAPSAMRCAA